jgi:death-on-curing protein
VTKRLTVDQVILIHRRLVCDAPLLYRDRLDGALAAPFQGMGDADFYPSFAQKAATHLESISRAHAVQDGNKRIAWLTAVTFVELNGLLVRKVPDKEAAEMVESLIIRSRDLLQVTLWINDLMTTRKDPRWATGSTNISRG